MREFLYSIVCVDIHLKSTILAPNLAPIKFYALLFQA